jgi:hypothetical protein
MPALVECNSDDYCTTSENNMQSLEGCDDYCTTIKKNLVVFTNEGEVTTVYERDEKQKQTDLIKPSPYRLVMITVVNSCQFCKCPLGPVYCHYVDIDSHFGFTSCSQCREKGSIAVTDWIDTLGYGRVNHLKNKSIKIQRSNNDIEDGWMLSSPCIIIKDSKEYIKCKSSDGLLERGCLIDTILELNN